MSNHTWWHAIAGFMETGQAPAPDIPGTLTAAATVSGRDAVIDFILDDADGIASIASAVMSSTDGRTSDADFTRTSTTRFSASETRRNARWRDASIAVTYTDNKGNQATLIASWDVS